jgi:hypothetical protein
MVWTYGKDKPPTSEFEYGTRSVMTAPYTTEPQVLAQTEKRLRSDPGQLSPYPYGIGCGYAARPISRAKGSSTSTDLMVVRLSDGVSWFIESPPLDQGFKFLPALGITCDEIVTRVQFPDDAVTIVRIPLDSLGPGIAPD